MALEVDEDVAEIGLRQFLQAQAPFGLVVLRLGDQEWHGVLFEGHAL